MANAEDRDAVAEEVEGHALEQDPQERRANAEGDREALAEDPDVEGHAFVDRPVIDGA
ncbi:MAG: hypothetical protein ACRDN6_00985 [Gaiellaceae bacterium]